VSSSGQPLTNVNVELHFSDNSYAKIDTKQFGCDLSIKSALKVCHVKTDSAGQFQFMNIAYGKYKLTSSYASENGKIKFQMQPESISVDLTGHQDVKISEQFKLSEVIVSSQASVKKNGALINSGEVLINGQKTPVGKDGQFSLALKSGTYKIQVNSDRTYFTSNEFTLDLSKSTILDSSSQPNQHLQALTNFVASAFDVCGQVSVIKEQNLPDLYKSIKINAYLSGQQMPVSSVNLDKNLKYCIPLKTNTQYILKAEITDAKLSKVLKLVPLEKKISVVDEPIVNVNFGQLEAKLDGHLVLLPNQNIPTIEDLIVTIKSDDSNQAWSKEIPAKCDQNLNCRFSLNNLLFGDYVISTNYDDLFCWKDQKKITIDSENKKITLSQAGFRLTYQLSHRNAVLKLGDLTTNVQTDSDRKGEWCLPAAKDYQLVIKSCHKYTEPASDVENVLVSQQLFKKNANKLSLRATKVQVDLQVVFRFEDSKQVVKAEDMYVEAMGENERVERINFELKTKSENEMVFSGKSWFAANQKVRFVAKSSKVLFEENTKKLNVNEQNCHLNTVNFEAKFGIFITGTVKPVDLTDILMTLTSASDQAVLETNLIKTSSFKLGPLKAPHTLYNVELVKSGYLFSKKLSESKNMDEVEYEFTAERLGQLKVNVVDQKLGSQLENVLLSLSSENRQFRQNYKTDANGETTFENLKPGLYYLIVMMQEYEFTPNSHPVRIADGDHTALQINAERTAYSCLGKVTSINGQAENNIEIAATGIYNTANADANMCAQSQESATVENGLYRIYNLKPKCEYTLRLKNIGTEKSQTSPIIPDNYGFVVQNANVYERNFVLLDQINTVDVSLGISFKAHGNQMNNMLNYYVKVKLFKMNQPDQVIQTQFAAANSIVYFNQLKRDATQQYSAQISLIATTTSYTIGSLSQQQQQQLSKQPIIESMELGFFTDSAHKHLTAKFDLDKKSQEYFDQTQLQQQYQNVYMTLPLFIVIIGILLNSSIVQKKLVSCQNFIEQKGGISRALQSTFQPAQLPNSPKSPRNRSKNETKNYHLKKGFSNDSSANESDLERSSKYQIRQQMSDSVFNQESANQDYEIINNEDVMDMQINNGRKQRVKKVD